MQAKPRSGLPKKHGESQQVYGLTKRVLRLLFKSSPCKFNFSIMSVLKKLKSGVSSYRNKPEENFFKDYLIEVPVQETGECYFGRNTFNFKRCHFNNNPSNMRLISSSLLCLAAPGSKAMSFHLSCPPEGSWAKLPENLTEKMANFDDKALKTDMEVPFSVPFCDHVPLDFGICHHQVLIPTSNSTNI